MNITPNINRITAGYQQYFIVRGVDNLGTTFQLVPEAFNVTNSIGVIEDQKTNGLLFKAIKYNSGNVLASFGTQSASASVEVYCGALKKMIFLDNTLQPVSEMFQAKEGHHYKFDIVGYDEFNNFIPVMPTLSSTGNIGSFQYQQSGSDSWASLFTLLGTDFGALIGKLGNVSCTQWIQVLPRNWQSAGQITTVASSNNSSAKSGSTPYVSYSTSSDTYQLYVKHWAGGQWIQDGGIINNDSTHSTLGSSLVLNGITPYIAWKETTNPSTNGVINFFDKGQVFVKYFNGYEWIKMGSYLNIDQSKYVTVPSINFCNSTPYIAWCEYYNPPVIGKPMNETYVYVKKWNGQDWIQVGGTVTSNTIPSLANIPISPTIAVLGSELFVTGNEGNTLVVKKWTGTTWENLGSSINLDNNNKVINSKISTDGTSLYVVWIEISNSINTLYVKKWNGTEWTLMESALNMAVSHNVINVDIAFDQDTPYIVWAEEKDSPGTNNGYYILSKCWDGKSWKMSGNRSPIGEGLDPRIVITDETPFVTYNPSGSNIVNVVRLY